VAAASPLAALGGGNDVELAFHGKIFVMGGGAESDHVFNTVEVLDIASGVWSDGPTMSVPRMSASSCILDDKVFVMGGSTSLMAGDPNAQTRHCTVEMLDLSIGDAQHWVPCASMAAVRSGLGAAEVAGFVYAFGGFNGTAVFESMERYEPQADKWLPAPSMQTKRFAFATVTKSGKIYAIGGGDGVGVLNKVECFDVVGSQWESCAPMGTQRLGVCAVNLGGTIYVMGGYDGENHLQTVERLGESGTWEMVSPMQCKRSSASAVVCGGCIYVCGGYNGDSRIESVEKYSPLAGSWESVPSMKCKRGGPTAVQMT